MFCARLADLRRTSGFRLALLFLTLFGLASMLLFGFVYWRALDYQRAQTDEWLRHEGRWLGEGPAAADLLDRVRDHSVNDPARRRPFGLFARDGRRLAGPLPKPPADSPLGEPFTFRRASDHGEEHYRVIARRTPSGILFAAAQDMREIDAVDDQLLHALLAGVAIMFGVGLAGAVILGAASTRRMEAMAAEIARVAAGDLTRRLPVGRHNADLDRLAIFINGMLDDIERLMSEVKGVCDDIAHDLRTPLTRLLAGLDRTSRRDTEAGELHAAIDRAIGEGETILRTFGAMLRISEAEQGARRIGFAMVDMARLAADVLDYYQPAAETREMALRLDDRGIGTTLGDADLLFEALANLIDNAIKFSPDGTVVTITLSPGPTIMVRDAGPGIPPEERDNVLRRFYRMEAARSLPGNGLGLALVAAVARLHRLRLMIADAGPGCRIELTAMA